MKQLEEKSFEVVERGGFNQITEIKVVKLSDAEQILNQALEEVEKECLWEYESDDCFYQTSCDMAFQFSHDDVEQEFKHFKWCPYCGKRIKAKSQLKGE